MYLIFILSQLLLLLTLSLCSFAFVLYMSVRIRKENTSKEDVAMEIGNNEVAIANAIEMQDNGLKTADAEMI